MKAILQSKTTILYVFFLLIILCFSSCKKNSQKEIANNTDAIHINDKEQIEAYFLIATANASKFIISKSQIAQQKGLQSKIRQISTEIENHQNELLQDLTKLANKKLIIVTEINAANKEDLYSLIDTGNSNFDKVYISSMNESLAEQIELFESISKETKDQMILKFVLHYLPKEYQFLQETEKIKQEIN